MSRQNTKDQQSILKDDSYADLEAVVYEILRLAGVVPATTRTATKDAIVLGKRIPKGTTLYFPLTMIASLPLEDTAADPTNPVMHHVKWQQESLGRFDPDRWLNDAGSFDGQSGARSLPFSAGQRGCFGKGLAVRIFPGDMDMPS